MCSSDLDLHVNAGGLSRTLDGDVACEDDHVRDARAVGVCDWLKGGKHTFKPFRLVALPRALRGEANARAVRATAHIRPAERARRIAQQLILHRNVDRVAATCFEAGQFQPLAEVAEADAVRGEVRFHTDVIGDPIIVRADSMPAYNFAVVIDDALMDVTCVIRGEDHISNTPRQVLLYEALGFEPPKFAHLSLVMGPDHAPLSKRHGATSVSEFREKIGRAHV